jgi:hypothetical protein
MTKDYHYQDEDLSILERFFFRIFEFILVPGFFMSTSAFVTGLLTIGALVAFYYLNNAIVTRLNDIWGSVYFLVIMALIVVAVVLTVSKLSKYRKIK